MKETEGARKQFFQKSQDLSSMSKKVYTMFTPQVKHFWNQQTSYMHGAALFVLQKLLKRVELVLILCVISAEKPVKVYCS